MDNFDKTTEDLIVDYRTTGSNKSFEAAFIHCGFYVDSCVDRMLKRVPFKNSYLLKEFGNKGLIDALYRLKESSEVDVAPYICSRITGSLLDEMRSFWNCKCPGSNNVNWCHFL